MAQSVPGLLSDQLTRNLTYIADQSTTRIERPSKIAINFTDENLESKILNLDGFLATVFQHEIDHLFGKLYIDRISNKELIMYEDEFLKINENL